MQKSKMGYRSIRVRTVSFALLLCATHFGFTQETPSVASPVDQQRTPAPNIAIGAGDLLNVVVFDTPELTTSVRVSQDGDINLPVLGLISVSGLNTMDAALKIQNELRSRHLILDPHVTVFIVEYASQGATVMGEVKAPGV